MGISPLTKRLHLIATGLLGILLVWELVLFANPEKNTAWNVLFNFGYAKMFLFAGLVALFFGRRNALAGARGAMMTFLGFGALSFAVALWKLVVTNEERALLSGMLARIKKRR